jgi:hypothetical protein
METKKRKKSPLAVYLAALTVAALSKVEDKNSQGNVVKVT